MSFLDLLKSNKTLARIPTVTFTGAVPTGISFLGQSITQAGLTKENILALDNFARFASNGAGGYNLIDNLNAIVSGVVPVYALASRPVTGIPERPAVVAGGFTHGTEIRIHKNCFDGGTSNPLGIFMKADTINDKWVPSNNAQLMFGAMGSPDAPLATLTAAGRFPLATDPIIPGGLLIAGSRLRIVMYYRKIGTSATLAQAQAWLGTDVVAATYNTNSIVYQLTSISATTNWDANSDTLVYFNTTTSLYNNRQATRGGTGNGGQWQNEVTKINTLVNMAVTFAMGVLTSPDTTVLIGYEVWLVA